MSEKLDLTSKICVHGDYWAGADRYCWVLMKRVLRERRGKDAIGGEYEDWESVGYYSSLAAVCKAVIKMSILDGVSGGELKDLKEVIEKSKQIERGIMDAIGTEL